MRGPVSGSGDRLVTQVVTLRYESALQLVNVLRPLITPNNTIAAYPGTNSLIITDYADNLRRIDKIIASLDQAAFRRTDHRDTQERVGDRPGAAAQPAGRRRNGDAGRTAR